MELKDAVQTINAAIEQLESRQSTWSIVVLDRGWVFVGKLSCDESGGGILTDAANIRKWGTTRGLPELQAGPTSSTQLDKCSMPVRFSSCILTLDANEDGWSNAY
jgi:hypothetical protein